MPISRLQFELGIDDGIEALMVSVYDLLDANRDTAYSEAELYDLFTANAPGSYIDTSHLDIALQKVVELGAVEERPVANSKYYAFRQEIDTATWELAASDDDVADEADAPEPDSTEASPEEPASA